MRAAVSDHLVRVRAGKARAGSPASCGRRLYLVVSADTVLMMRLVIMLPASRLRLLDVGPRRLLAGLSILVVVVMVVRMLWCRS